MSTDINSQLDQSGVFRDFPEDAKDALSRISSIVKLSDANIIYSRGEAPSELYGVLSGTVKLVGENSEGKYYLYGLVPPGHWFGEISALDGVDRAQTAIAVGDTQLSCIPRADLLRLLESCPVLYRHFISVFCGRLRLAGQFIEETAFSPVAVRLANQLLRFAKRKEGFPLALSQEDLAASLGVTRQSIYRTISKWQKLGWIDHKYGSIDVVDPAMLRSYIDEHERGRSSEAPRK